MNSSAKVMSPAVNAGYSSTWKLPDALNADGRIPPVKSFKFFLFIYWEKRNKDSASVKRKGWTSQRSLEPVNEAGMKLKA